jgi:hypothetical protein
MFRTLSCVSSGCVIFSYRGVCFRTEGAAYVGFVTDKVAWGRFDSQVLRFPCIIPPTLHSSIYPFICHRRHILWIDSIVTKYLNSRWDTIFERGNVDWRRLWVAQRGRTMLWTYIWLRSVLFWNVAHNRVAIPYRRCGTTCRSRLRE